MQAMEAVRDAALRMSMSALQRNVIPDVVLRWGVRKLLEGRLREIARPTLEGQTQELLAFAQCRAMSHILLVWDAIWRYPLSFVLHLPD